MAPVLRGVTGVALVIRGGGGQAMVTHRRDSSCLGADRVSCVGNLQKISPASHKCDAVFHAGGVTRSVTIVTTQFADITLTPL